MRLLGRIPVLGPFLLDLPFPLAAASGRHGEREDRVRRLRGQGLAMLTVASGLAYLVWLAGVIDRAHPIVGAAFLVVEAGWLGLFVLASVSAWRMRTTPAVAPMPSRPVPVDVFITVCGEPVPVIARTLEAAVAVQWVGVMSVYVLDDLGVPEVEALAMEAGARYVSRAKDGAGHRDHKAGNLNYGLAHAHGDYVLTLDADQIPEPDILERLAPQLALPRTAFVQSRQVFHVPEGDPFYSQDLVFYNTLQPAFAAHGMVLSRGSGVLYRRAALDENGGFATWNLVEDLTTSYELHSRGWRLTYYPMPLSVGLAPDTVWGVYRQRGQWAFDAMRLFWWRNPLLRTGLAWPQRLNYFLIGYACLVAGVLAPIAGLFPIWTYVSGQTVSGREVDLTLYRALYLGTMALASRWLFRHQEPGRQFQMLVGLFPVHACSALRALLHPRSKPGYTVNHGVPSRPPRAWPSVLAVSPQLVLLLANAAGPFYALLMETAPPSVIGANACVSAMVIWSLSHVCLAAHDPHRWQNDPDPERCHALPARR